MVSIVVKDTAMAVEEIAWKYRLEALGGNKAKAARLEGFVEQIYILNPGLAAIGPLIPVGTTIVMPPTDSTTRPAPNRLWG